jgi:hypothetical protein
MVLFNHNAMYVPVTNWEKTTKAMEESGTLLVTNRKVVASYNLQYLFWHAEGKQVVTGKVLAAFVSAKKWSGTGGMDGCRVEIELSADTAADAVCTMIVDRLPAGSQLAQLAQMMLEHTQRWLLMVHKHLDAELTKLTQMNILEEEALILLSEEVIIMFDRFYAIRRKRMDFVVKGNRVEYMVRCIWILLQVHMAMDDFIKDGLKYNLAISAAFIRFLTKHMGGNVSAGVGSQIQVLKDEIKKVGSVASDAKTAAAGASACCTTATNAADKVAKSFEKLFQANLSLKK